MNLYVAETNFFKSLRTGRVGDGTEQFICAVTYLSSGHYLVFFFNMFGRTIVDVYLE